MSRPLHCASTTKRCRQSAALRVKRSHHRIVIAGLEHRIEAQWRAHVYSWRGEKDKASDWLERCYQQRVSDLTYIKGDPLLDPLRGEPRYKSLLRKMNLPVRDDVAH